MIEIRNLKKIIMGWMKIELQSVDLVLFWIHYIFLFNILDGMELKKKKFVILQEKI